MAFLPRPTGGYEQDPVEMGLMQRGLSGVEMGEMNRIECSAEDSGSHGNEDRAGEVSPDATPY